MTPETRKLLLSRLMLEADRGCPSGFREHVIQEPTPREVMERMERTKTGSVLRRKP